MRITTALYVLLCVTLVIGAARLQPEDLDGFVARIRAAMAGQ